MSLIDSTHPVNKKTYRPFLLEPADTIFWHLRLNMLDHLKETIDKL
jgi:hypothetical protein